MSEISAADVMKLRNLTGMQMMKCKAALTEACGDFDKAIQILREQTKGAMVKFAAREAAEGRVGVYIDPATQTGAIVEMRCETAPSAKNDLFIKLANDVAKQIALKGATNAEELLAQPFVDDPAHTLNDRITDVVGLIRENMKPSRFGRLTGGQLGSYIHHDGTVGVLLQVEGKPADPAVLRDVCMHIAARSPLAALREHLPPEVVTREREIAKTKAAEEGKGKPANIIEKIAEGMLSKGFFAENVLNEQEFVKDKTKTVGALLKAAGVQLVGFIRYKVGEVGTV
jgi:elongation factor Ts